MQSSSLSRFAFALLKNFFFSFFGEAAKQRSTIYFFIFLTFIGYEPRGWL
jgi:hypothetical protein